MGQCANVPMCQWDNGTMCKWSYLTTGKWLDGLMGGRH